MRDSDIVIIMKIDNHVYIGMFDVDTDDTAVAPN
jgi:hypothetical protein